MNQDQVKVQLSRLQDDVEPYSLIFTGKSSRKVNGLYHPESREILIHNRNFETDSELMYTAIHEFAHHVHFTTSPVPVGPRAHTLEFRSILHRLLRKAQETGVYANPFESDPEFRALTERLRDEFLTRNGQVMKRFGAALIEAEALCRKRGARFEDYVERVLSLDRRTAQTLMKIHRYDIDPTLGYHNMATVAGIAGDERRKRAEQAFLAGGSPDMVKVDVRAGASSDEPDARTALERERNRLQRTIHSLQEKLDEIEERIGRLGSPAHQHERA